MILLALVVLWSLLEPPPLDINTASKARLTTLPGVGSATALAIVEYRESIAPFHSVDELVFVPGIGPATLEALRPYISASPVEVPFSDPVRLSLAPPSDTLLTVVFLDVGNGDAIAVTAGGETWLFDGGPPGEGAVRAPVVHRLFESGIDTLSTVVFTHPHADHIGGVADAMQVFGAAELIDPGIEYPSPLYEGLLQHVLESGASYTVPEAGDRWNLSPHVAVEVVWLDRHSSGINENSAVFLITCGDFSLLLTGDIENETLMRLTPGQTPVTVMKVPHHGSRSSLFPPWFRRASPQWAVVTCGRGNPFGHPHPDVLACWEATGAEILRTDLNGNIFLYTDGESVFFSATRP